MGKVAHLPDCSPVNVFLPVDLQVKLYQLTGVRYPKDGPGFVLSYKEDYAFVKFERRLHDNGFVWLIPDYLVTRR